MNLTNRRGRINQAYIVCKQHDQLLMSWLLSSQLKIFHCETRSRMKRLRGDPSSVKKSSLSMNELLLKTTKIVSLLLALYVKFSHLTV